MRPYLTTGERPILFAHRGGAALWPENTLLAFQGALHLGYRYIETDVHRTRDGVFVCHHDATVDRTTNGTGAIAGMTLAEIRRFDAGYRFTTDGGAHPFRGKGVNIPTFEELFSLSPDVRVNVEIKQRKPDACAPFIELIDRLGIADRVLVAAGSDRIGRRFRALSGGRVATSPGAPAIFRFWLAVKAGVSHLLKPDYDALQVPEFHRGLHVVSRRFVVAAHRVGLHVHVWTVDHPADMRRMMDLGVDGIMTDRPDLLLEVAGPRPEGRASYATG
jgi:glycerophosphoryl diester phosphodiesterase